MLFAYTDGSYRNDKVGWGYVIIDDNENIIHEEYGSTDEFVEMRNVTGELTAIRELLYYCEENDFKEITICHDYLGVRMWVTREWKAKNKLTQAYRQFVLDSPMKIQFQHVKGHSKHKWNDYADKLASIGTSC